MDMTVYQLVFEGSLKNAVFPEILKKANIVHGHKEEDKTLMKNYWMFLVK